MGISVSSYTDPSHIQTKIQRVIFAGSVLSGNKIILRVVSEKIKVTKNYPGLLPYWKLAMR